MTRTIFTGARIVDGTGADPAEADLVVEDGRIVEIGPGLDGDDSVDLTGKAVLPGLFVILTVLALNLLGDAINDALNPHFRKR